jgi:AcrR family transcriptional regulator
MTSTAATAGDVAPDRRADRRAARRAQSTSEILDASEKVFGTRGLSDGSLREVADEAGFSTGALYLFFENKQHLIHEMLTRRGTELNALLREVAESDRAPLDALHHIIDATRAFFADRPNFRLLIRHLSGGATIIGPALAEYADETNAGFAESQALLASIIERGQARNDLRAGDPLAIAHLYSVLVNEYVLFDDAGDEPSPATLTSEQFHALVDGALRHPR